MHIYLQVILVALAQLGGDLGLGAGHVVDASLNCDYSLQVEAVDVVNGGHGDLCVCILHNALNGVSTLANDTANQVIVGQDLQ